MKLYLIYKNEKPIEVLAFFFIIENVPKQKIPTKSGFCGTSSTNITKIPVF